jgi:hypothetical protein
MFRAPLASLVAGAGVLRQRKFYCTRRTFITEAVRAGRNRSDSGFLSEGDDRTGLLRAALFAAECRRFATARS